MLFKIPIFKSARLHEEVSKIIDIDPATIDRYLKKLVDAKVLITEQGKQREKKYYFKILIDEPNNIILAFKLK